MRPKKNILIAVTGSVASMKLPILVAKLTEATLPIEFNIKIVVTEESKHFFEMTAIPEKIQILDNHDEWISWSKRGDPVVHIDLGKWADIMVIAPLSANSLAKIASGICDNLFLCIVRAWDMQKPLLFCPAMNTRMYEHPITREHIDKLLSWGYKEIPCISKTLMCGDTGNGAMAEVSTIVSDIVARMELDV